jgi:hypothetical protein
MIIIIIINIIARVTSDRDEFLNYKKDLIITISLSTSMYMDIAAVKIDLSFVDLNCIQFRTMSHKLSSRISKFPISLLATKPTS